jgi:hypothetical protein
MTSRALAGDGPSPGAGRLRYCAAARHGGAESARDDAGHAARSPGGRRGAAAQGQAFDHENHAGKPGIACTTCHHPSRRRRP